MNNNQNKIIPIFFATDDNYVPFLGVAINSLISNASNKYTYNIHVLNEGLTNESMSSLKSMETDNVNIIFNNVKDKIEHIKSNLDSSLRDYYTSSIFYRIFIASMFPHYNKAIYLDCDLVIVDDISKMYEIDVKDKIFGVITDDVIAGCEEFREYATNGVGVNYQEYFNSGVLLINLEEYRKEQIEKKFISLLVKYNFETAAPDQDYLNVLCNGKVKYLEKGWDKMPTDANYNGELHIIHYNNFRKPWFYDDVLYGEYFWQYVPGTPFEYKINEIKSTFNDEMAQKHIAGAMKLIEQTKRIVASDNNFKNTLFTNAPKKTLDLFDVTIDQSTIAQIDQLLDFEVFNGEGCV